MGLNIKFWLNGQRYCINKRIKLSDLINYFNYSEKLFVLEHNNLICSKAIWETILISNLDRLEIVTIVGGG